MGVIYLGPYGRLMSVDVPSDGFDSTMVEYGSLHEALSGMHTKDVFGWKRVFALPLAGLHRRALSWFEMLYRGSIAGPYFLRDPRRINLLHAAVSDTMSSYSRQVPFVVSTGTVAQVATARVLLSSQRTDSGVTYIEQSPGPSYAAQWVAAAAGTAVAGRTPVPVLPGETMIFSYYLVAGAPTPGFATYATASSAAVTVNPAVQTDPADATRRFVRYTVPSDGSVQAVLPVLAVAAAGTVTVLACQLEGQRATTDVPRAWVLGTGVPKVIVNNFPQHSEHLGNYTSGSLELVEA